ncbi:MAG TPA: UbiD family decarboxylase [Desulfuromonadaceae bacterium]|jgi:4-hydroxy-3-polyprenylbenzoate decarboxylase
MPVINDLHQFIALLESRQQLIRIKSQVDPLQEIAAITDRVCKTSDGGKALIFEHPLGSSFPVATNLFGSLPRIGLALGLEHPDLLTDKLSALLQQIVSPVLDDLDAQIAALPDFTRYLPRLCEWPGATKVQDAPDLGLFPFLQAWPEDGSASGHPRYISLPLVITADTSGGNPNCGMYRAQVCGSKELAIRWKPESGAGRHLEEFRQAGKPMPVAIALGGDPAITLSAMSPLPGKLDEITFAGFLRGDSIDMAACCSIPLSVPLTSEVVIEGYVDPIEQAIEGPFGNHTGLYSPAGPAALMRITSISHREDAIIPATIVGPPPMEDCWMGKAWERLLLAFLQRLVPGVIEINFPLEWIFHQSAVISLEKPVPAMVRETANLLWSMPWFSASRILIFISPETDSKLANVAWQFINLPEFKEDLFYDHTGRRLALDATGGRLQQQRLKADQKVLDRISRHWPSFGLD